MLLVPFNSDPSNVFTVALGDGVKYTFETRWNAGFLGDGGFWTFDMTRQVDGVRLASGVPILLGQDLAVPYAFGSWSLIAIDESNADLEAGEDDLGVRVNVYWFSAEELAAAGAASAAQASSAVTSTPPAGAVTAANFTPLSLGASLKMWLRPDRGITLSGSNLTAWTDYSGNGNDVTAAGTIPLTASINGRSALAMPGGSVYLINTTKNIVTPGSARTVFVVAKASSEFGGPLIEFQRTSGNRFTLFQGGSGYTPYAAGVYTDSVDGARNATIVPGTISGVPMIYEFSVSALQALLALKINGVAQAITQASPCSSESGAIGFTIGRWEAGGANCFLGALGDVIVCDALSAANATLVRGWLATWYGGITVA